jgi:hypothetical protein
MAPKHALLSGGLPKAMSARARRDCRWATGGSEELVTFHTVSMQTRHVN